MSLKVKILIWFGILVGAILAVPVAFLASGTFRNFYVPSESMRPTFEVNDRFAARLGGAPAELHRGDILLVSAPGGGIYVSRVAGLPGDRIAVHEGIVLLNGRPVAQRPVRVDPVEPSLYGDRARRLSEQFPGEAAAHEIYDSGASSGDEFEEQTVRPGHIFLLGDNRDHAADSRFSAEDLGLEQVPLANVRGAPRFFTWAAGRSFGDPAGH